MTIYMKINNPTNWETATKYSKKYTKRIEALFPEIRNIELEITKMNTSLMDNENPLSYKKDSLDNKAHIYYNENVVNDIADEIQIYALLSHEVGHMLADYKQENCRGTEEEIIADNYAYKLGLGKGLLNALIHLKNNYNNNQHTLKQQQPFIFSLPSYSTIVQKNNDEYDRRIGNLKKQLRKTPLLLLKCIIQIRVLLYRITNKDSH